MKPVDDSEEAVKAATDAVFQQGAPVTVPPEGNLPLLQVTQDVSATSDEQAAPTDPVLLLLPPIPEARPSATSGTAKGPLEDYVRELGQEFQDQQEEGKL